MKRLLSTILILALLTACTKSSIGKPDTSTAEDFQEAAEVSQNTEYVNPPQISITTGHQYKGESWAQDNHEVKDQPLVLSGDSLFITVIFDRVMDRYSMGSNIKLSDMSPTEINVHNNKDNCVVYCSFRDIKTDTDHKLTISSGVMDLNRHTLEKDIEVKISLYKDTSAFYTFVGSTQTYEGLGNCTIIDPDAVGEMHLTASPKRFLINFTAVVDKRSVEESIAKGFEGQSLKYDLKWNNEKQVEVYISNLKTEGNTNYCISMENALDANGNKILGNLYFKTGSANKLGVIDVDSRSNKLIRELEDKLYMAWNGYSIEDYIFLTDTANSFAYDLKNNTVSRLELEHGTVRGIAGYDGFLPSKAGKLYFYSNESIMSYNLSNGELMEAAKLEKPLKEDYVIETALSPDGSLFAIVTAIAYEAVSLYVYDLDGKLVYEKTPVGKGRIREVLGETTNICWLDNENLLMEDAEGNEPSYYIARINIISGKKEVFEKQALAPLTLPESNMIKFEKYANSPYGERSYAVLVNNTQQELFKEDQYIGENLHLLNANQLVFNKDDEIILYDISKKAKSTLGKGYICGVSRDGKKVYYITNQQFLYYIP